MSMRTLVNHAVLLSVTLGLLTACGEVKGGDFVIERSPWPWPRQAEFRVQETVSDSVPVAGHTRIRLAAVNGHISIQGVPGATSVSVAAVLQVGSFDSREDATLRLSQLDVRVSELPEVILVETVQPLDPMGRQYVVDYDISVPSDLDVDVDQVNGSVWIEGMAGSAFANISNGNIDGTVDLPLGGEIWMSTANGDVELQIPTTTDAALFARSDNGAVDVRNLELSDPVSTSGSVSGILGDGSGDIHLETANGRVVVTGFDR